MKVAQVSSNQIIRLSVILALLMVVVLIPYEILFDETRVVCIHQYLFGFQCPLCGMTRAVHEFTHLRIASAINYNVVVVLLPGYLVVDATSVFYPQKWLAIVKKTVVVIIIAGFLLLYVFRIVQHFN